MELTQKIAVIVPVYNTEDYIPQCVESILKQTYGNLIVLLVDDGSTDLSGDICDQYERSDKRVKVIHQQNRGQGAARNAGLNWIKLNSDASWVCFIDSDDWVHSRMIEYLYSCSQLYKSQIAVCNFERVTERGFANDNLGFVCKEEIPVEDFYCNNKLHSVVVWGKLYHISLFANLRFPEIRACEDVSVAYITLFTQKKIPFVKAPLYYYYLGVNSTMRARWSPKRLLAISEREAQMAFLKNTNYKIAYKDSCKQYLQTLSSELILLKKDDNHENEKYRKIVKRKLRKQLISMRHLICFRENQWVYEQAFPFLMKMYWLIIGKISRK